MKVYKYRGAGKDLERDLNSISENYFYAPNAEKLNDPCETLVFSDRIQNQTKLVGKIFGKKSYAVPLDLGYEIKIQLYLLQIKDFYGISINQVGVQKIYNPPDIQKALEKEKTAEIEKRFSQITGQASGEEMGEAIKNTAEIASIDPNIAAFVYGLAKFFTPKSGDTKTTGGSK